MTDGKCKCGRVTWSSSNDIKITEMRCPFCPPDKPPPKLKLVK